ncbi:hypothetical protein TSUD_385790 [Trifolium subterraneum]|uniref:Exportin-1 C-terminal domain-containing protein n=1 Tax=Trifolium subterraneum TaxID=3900 RepID=A0A2Z6LVS2_TRISU|nr:hypothetical protein TSUD_385790 [Trifolium subterraneum]
MASLRAFLLTSFICTMDMGFARLLPRIVDSLASLLESGADREPDIIEQIFTSWSHVMMYLQKYLIENPSEVLK